MGALLRTKDTHTHTHIHTHSNTHIHTHVHVRRGAELALKELVEAFGDETLAKLPFLLDSASETLCTATAPLLDKDRAANPLPEDLQPVSAETATALTRALTTMRGECCHCLFFLK